MTVPNSLSTRTRNTFHETDDLDEKDVLDKGDDHDEREDLNESDNFEKRDKRDDSMRETTLSEQYNRVYKITYFL